MYFFFLMPKPLLPFPRSSGEDCSHCGPKVVTADDVKDVEVPEWKKKALEQNSNTEAAPFGLSWTAEKSTTATEAHEHNEVEHDEHHHDHHHSHGAH
jgi:hypothetical protein